MRKIITAAIVSLTFISTAYAGAIADIYADMDAKMMSSNLNIFDYYSPDAVIVVPNEGGYLTVDNARERMQKNIRDDLKYEVYQSQIKGMREVRTSFMKKLCAIVVFSRDYSKVIGNDPNHPGKRITLEQTRMTTRVFNTIDPNPRNWKIISEQSDVVPSETRVNGKPVGQHR